MWCFVMVTTLRAFCVVDLKIVVVSMWRSLCGLHHLHVQLMLSKHTHAVTCTHVYTQEWTCVDNKGV